MDTRRELRRQLVVAVARTVKAEEKQTEAEAARDTALGNEQRMAGQLSEVREELAALRKTGTDTDAWAEERQDLRRRLLLANTARERLTRQLEQLQAANEALNEVARARTEHDEEAMTA
jgi:hypothetical protein